MNNPYGLVLDDASLRWAAAESVSEAVIAAIACVRTVSILRVEIEPAARCATDTPDRPPATGSKEQPPSQLGRNML
jgi:hypothetical protein